MTLDRKIVDLKASHFPESIQRLLGMYVFFLAFPSVVVGFSITFYIFLILAYQVYRHYGYVVQLRKFNDYLFIIFPIIAFVSLLVAPTMKRAPGFFADAQLWIQYIYWIVVALFVKTHGSRFDWARVFRSIFWGVNALIFCYFLIGISFSFAIVTFLFKIPRNAFIFQLLCLVPFCLYYVLKQWGKLSFILASFFYLFITLRTEGRAGSILIFMEIVLLVIIVNGFLSGWVRFVALGFLVAGSIFIADDSFLMKERKILAQYVEPNSKRLASLLEGEGEGDLTQDQSWLMRKLMIQKAKEISASNLWFGIGVGHFTIYDARLVALKQNQTYKPILGEKIDFYNTKSAHNTYFQILAETGFLGLVVFLVLLLHPLIKFIYAFVFSPSRMQFMSISLLAISIHFFVISSITGAIPWFIIGVAYFFNSNETRFLLPHPHTLKT